MTIHEQNRDCSSWRALTAAIREDAPSARHIMGEIYRSPQIYAREKERIFLKTWLCVAREEEVENPGDYMSLRIMDESIVIARDDSGHVVAYQNMCLHRGVELAYGRGNARRLVCPYHSWTYDIGGKLLGGQMIRETGVEMIGRQLPRLGVALWRGWVFVNFDLNAEPFEEFIAPWEARTWWYQTGECRIAFKREFQAGCNWKFVVENVEDYLHAYAVHGGTFGRQFKFGEGKLPFEFFELGGVNAEFDTSNRQNPPPIFPRLPWLEDKPDFASAKAAIYPNMNTFINHESVRSSTYWPDGPEQMRYILYFLLPKDYFKLPDFDKTLEFYREQIDKIFDEDRVVLEGLQRAAKSALYRPGPVLRMEEAVQHIIRNYLDKMGL